MFSKAWLKVFICISAGMGALGCSAYLNGKTATPEVIEFSNDKFSCLKLLPDYLKKMTSGTASELEIRDGFACTEGSILYFEKRTEGSLSDGYTGEDIRNFFGKYFFKKNNMTAEAVRELLKFKKALFGGSPDWVSRNELKRLVDFLRTVKEEVISLQKHISLLLMQKNAKTIMPLETEAATEQLRSSLQRLLRSTELAKSDYSFEDAKRLFIGVSSSVVDAAALAPYKNFAKWVPLAESVKRFLLGEHAQLGGVNDWSLALDNFVDLYGIFLSYHYVIQHHPLDNKKALQQATQFGLHIYKLVQDCFQMTKSGQIPFSDIDSLIDQALAVFKPRLNLTAGTLKETYRIAVLKFLEPYRNGDSRGMSTLTKVHVLSLKREINVWRLSQAFADSLQYNGLGLISQVKLLESYRKFELDEIIRSGIETDPTEQGALRRSWTDFGTLLKSAMPVVFNTSGRYIISNQQKNVPQSWKSLTKFNVLKAFDRLLHIGYGDKNPEDIANATISEDSLIKAYDDFKFLGLELKAFDPRNANTGGRSFMEANFFTFSGNGDSRMDFKESFEFLSILVSAGLGTSADISKAMESISCVSAQVDVFGFKKLKEACFRSEFQKNFEKYFDNLGPMNNYLNTLSRNGWNGFYSTLMKAARVSDPREGLIETADLRTMVVVLHYADGLMASYDTDANKKLSLREIYRAAPRFMSFLRQLQPGNSDNDLRDALAYILIYGKKPSRWDMISFKAGKVFSDPPEAEPVNILKVIEVLKDQLN